MPFPVLLHFHCLRITSSTIHTHTIAPSWKFKMAPVTLERLAIRTYKSSYRPHRSHSNVGAGIGGGVVAAIIALMIIIFICTFIYKYRKGIAPSPLPSTPPTLLTGPSLPRPHRNRKAYQDRKDIPRLFPHRHHVWHPWSLLRGMCWWE